MKSYDLSNVSVLIVEQHPQMRTLLRQIMRQFGVANTFDAYDPEAAFDRFIDTSPDIVFIDWTPDFDGLKLTGRIRAGEKSANPWTSIILCTAYTERHHIIVARDAGVTEFLAKPVSAKSIYNRIVSVIDDPRAFVRADTFSGPDRRRKENPHRGDERRKDWQPMNENAEKEKKTGKLANPP